MQNQALVKYIQESITLREKIVSDRKFISHISKTIKVLKNCFNNGSKLLIAGNGGSAADSQHFAAEIVGRYKKERRGYPAIALTTDTSILTAWGNDYDFESVFSRQIESLGQQGDIFLGISTSGNSKNVILAVKKAKEMGMITIGLLGNNGGNLKDLVDMSIIVPSTNTARIQEVHITIIHILCEEIEHEL